MEQRKKESLGKSILDQNIWIEKFGYGNEIIHLLAGVHGDEHEGIILLQTLINDLRDHSHSTLKDLQFHVVLQANPDACIQKRRTNQRNVDINRNYPTKDWQSTFTNPRYYPGAHQASEPETQAHIHYLTREKPNMIITMHSFEKALINYNGNCRKFAQIISKINNLPAVDSIGYPTLGSLGTYAGIERNIPTITLEILKGQAAKESWQIHGNALLQGLQWYNEVARKRKEVGHLNINP